MDNENTTQPVIPTEKSKKSIYIAIAVLIVIALIAWGLSMIKKPAENAATNPCAIDLASTVYEYASTSAPISDVTAARAVFDHYFSVYKTMPQCGSSALSDFKLISIGAATPQAEKNKYTVPVVFDLKPLSMEETKWKDAPEVKIDGEWIRGKKGVLSIWRHDDVYQLLIL